MTSHQGQLSLMSSSVDPLGGRAGPELSRVWIFCRVLNVVREGRSLGGMRIVGGALHARGRAALWRVAGHAVVRSPACDLPGQMAALKGTRKAWPQRPRRRTGRGTP